MIDIKILASGSSGNACLVKPRSKHWGMDIATGTRFNKLKVIKEVEPIYRGGNHRIRRFLCLCDCGGETTVELHKLRSGHTKSCGCRIKEMCKLTHSTHGCEPKRIYRIWQGILNRCRNRYVKSYRDYGGKGVTVCKKWLEFISFRDWALGNGYEDNLTIERINVFGNYEPSNCTWIPKSEQMKNRRDNPKYDYLRGTG